MKPDRRSLVPLPTDISLNIEVGWNESHAVFDELGVPRGKRIDTFLAAFCFMLVVLVHTFGQRC